MALGPRNTLALAGAMYSRGISEVSPNHRAHQKTKMCRFHVAGRCQRGARCFFAHSPEEQRDLPQLPLADSCAVTAVPHGRVSSAALDDAMAAADRGAPKRVQSSAQRPPLSSQLAMTAVGKRRARTLNGDDGRFGANAEEHDSPNEDFEESRGATAPVLRTPSFTPPPFRSAKVSVKEDGQAVVDGCAKQALVSLWPASTSSRGAATRPPNQTVSAKQAQHLAGEVMPFLLQQHQHSAKTEGFPTTLAPARTSAPLQPFQKATRQPTGSPQFVTEALVTAPGEGHASLRRPRRIVNGDEYFSRHPSDEHGFYSEDTAEQNSPDNGLAGFSEVAVLRTPSSSPSPHPGARRLQGFQPRTCGIWREERCPWCHSPLGTAFGATVWPHQTQTLLSAGY